MKTKIIIFFIVAILNIAINVSMYANTYQEYKSLYDSGNTDSIDEAIQGFRQLIKKNPRHENIADMEYIIAQNEKSYTRSLDLLSELFRRRKNYSKRDEVGFTLASRFMLQNGYISALNVFKDIEKNYPSSPHYMESRLMIASIYLKLNEIKQSINEYQKIMASYSDDDTKDNDYYRALFGLGNAYFAQEQYYLALGTYNRLLEINPNFSERAFVLYRSALCYEYTGRTAEALEIYNMISDVYSNTQSRTLAVQRLKIHEASANTATFADDELETINTTNTPKLEKPTIYESNNINVYQFGKFRSIEKSNNMLEIIESLGYNGYVVEANDVFIVRLDIYDDERNIEEMRTRFNRAGIPFFIVE